MRFILRLHLVDDTRSVYESSAAFVWSRNGNNYVSMGFLHHMLTECDSVMEMKMKMNRKITETYSYEKFDPLA